MEATSTIGSETEKIIAELEKSKRDFDSGLDEGEEVLKCIDIKKATIGAANNIAIYGSYSDAAVHQFLFETNQNLYVLMCNVKGQKIKVVKLDFSEVRFVFIKQFSNRKLFQLVGKDDWYISCDCNIQSWLELQDLANERKIPMKFVKRGYIKTQFFSNPMRIFYWILIFGLILATFFSVKETMAGM